jgi:MFS family permease
MLLQGLTLVILIFANTMTQFIMLSVSLGWGTALVYPTFLATVAENTHPSDRANSLGVFRLWRDLGYAIGAILTGVIADAIGMNVSIIFIGALTLASGLIIYYRMKCIGQNFIKIRHWLLKVLFGKAVISNY